MSPKRGYFDKLKLSSLLVLLLTTIEVVFSALTFNGARLSSLPRPDFTTSFELRSNNGSDSFREVFFGDNFGRPPFRVRVYAKVQSGTNEGFCFEAVGSAQVSIRKQDSLYSYGGLVYGYNSSHVRIWAPTKFKHNDNGRIVFIGYGWGHEVYRQSMASALVVVQVWYIGPLPTFQTSVLVDTRLKTRVFHEIMHNLEELPERVAVRVTPRDKSSANYGFWFHGITSSQNVEKKGYGGVIFAYNAQKIVLWAPSAKRTGCVFVQNGWGDEINHEIATNCLVEVYAWVFKYPIPSYTTNWVSLSSQGGRDRSFLQIQHRLGVLPSIVLVQVRSDNKALVFEGSGAVMSTDANSKGYGGVVYAFDENTVRLWLPERYNGTRNGYSILVRDGWGDGVLPMRYHNVFVRVTLYTTNCESSREVVTQRGLCKTLTFQSYSWQTGSWGRCSSICNQGNKYRRVTGCQVSTRETVLTCGFAMGMCRFQAHPLAAWSRHREPQPRNHMWNYPSDSYYVFAAVNSSSRPVVLASPRFSPRKSCSLKFKYKMIGRPAPKLSVLVSSDGHSSPRLSDWKMVDNQGGLFWREGYVKLTKFNKLTQVLFKFTLSRKPENDRSPSYGNVSLDDVILECEGSHEKVEDVSVCRENKTPSVGCVHNAFNTTERGPAFDVDSSLSSDQYVMANGDFRELIASYEFMVDIGGEFTIWLYAKGTSNKNNGVMFQIDNLDPVSWHTTYIDNGNRPVWSHFLYTTFTLKPGVHTVHLFQLEHSFKFKRIALIPKRVQSWTPLGMQSRYIPDSNLKAYPPASVPEPKYGRLHGQDAWCSSDHNKGFVRLEITLPELALVSRIAVQGGQHIRRRTNSYWVTRFSLKISPDGLHYSTYRVSPQKKYFKGNIDAGGIVEHELPFAVLAKSVQIFPYAWKNWICMRVELYGAYMTDNMCAAAGQEPRTREICHGDKNCGKNANCQQVTKHSIIKTDLPDTLAGSDACHCHVGYHGDSCQHVGCSPDPCKNGGSCLAHPTNFTCVCPPGFHGPLCQYSCPAGWYGVDCARMCRCSVRGICNVVTGYCSCQPGYFGISCGQRCPLGYYGDNCRERCQCRNNGDCDHVNGSCDCKTGWTGRFCDQPCRNKTWGVHCRLPCQCMEKNTMSCNPVTGGCYCRSGAMGKTCQDSCPSHKFGTECSGTCKCGAHGTCNAVNGTCACHSPGYTGIQCDQPCPKGTYGLGCIMKCDCGVNGECNHISGQCQCNGGFTGPHCNQPCAKDRWGPGCHNTCQCNYSDGCDGVTGACQCSPGWYGTSCSSSCSNNTWGTACKRACNCTTSSCDQATGLCLCSPGRTGLNCDVACPDGFYGSQCARKCSCRHDTNCDPITGLCHCRPGWLGTSCTQACPTGRYGMNCSDVCRCVGGSSCDHVTGSCACAAGWQGPACDMPCTAGSFGLSCAQRCSCHKDHSERCDQVTGHCHCKPGYIGARCDESCPPGFHGVNCKLECLCQNGAECEPADGSCTCLAGYHGEHCEHACPARYYGVNCGYKCSSCIENQMSPCDPVTGKCQCTPGYYGYHCQNHCPEGFYGPECHSHCDCKHDGHCDHVNGSCDCAPGYTGVRCDQPCPAGRFGEECSGLCLCENGGSCDQVTGECLCNAGYNGTRCRDVCPAGRYGIGCRQKCSCTWNHTQKCRGDTGTCECHAGYRGNACDEYCTDGTYGKACKHACPVCSRHVTGSCYKIDGRCPCSPGYRGHLCDNDCLLKNYGKGCLKRCRCQVNQICYHVNGSCYDITPGLAFHMAIKENYSEFDDTQRQKQFKLHVARFIESHHEKYLETLRRVTRRDIPPPQSYSGAVNTTTTTTTPTTTHPLSTSVWYKPEPKHDFVARILTIEKGLSSNGGSEVTLLSMVIFDKAHILNGSVVKQVMDSIPGEDLSEIIGAVYYTGALYHGTVTTPSVYVQLITGVAGGLLILIVAVITAVIYKRRRRHRKKLKTQQQKEKDAETEMELKTRSFRHNGYRLAFDNPYYDVLAAMALDDDIEEDYINPLCDLESLMSHHGSDGTVSSATECSIPKGDSLQSVSYC